MKRLIRNRRFRQFLTDTGTWTIDHVQAQLFSNDEAARKAREEFWLVGCELYYLVGEQPSGSDFAMPLERL